MFRPARSLSPSLFPGGFAPWIVVAAVCGALLALAVSPARAQQQMPPPLPPANPAQQPLPPQQLPGLPNAPVNGFGAEPATVQMLYPNAEIREVLDYYEELTGKRVLTDPTVQGKLNILINKKVTRSEAIRIIETALNLSDYTLVAGPGDIVKVIGLGKLIKNQGTPIYSELSELPESEQTVSFLIQLRHLDAAAVMNVLSQFIPPTSRSGATLVQSSGAIIITDLTSTVRRVVGLINQLDVPVTPVVEKFIPLLRADATKAVEFLNAVFENKNSGQGGAANVNNTGFAGAGNPNVRRPIRRVDNDGQPVFDGINPAPGQTAGNLAGALAQLSGEGIVQGTVKLFADVRTNRVHVVTQERNLGLVTKLIEDFDANTRFATPKPRALKFVNARDVLPILVSSLTEPGMENNNQGGTSDTSSSSTGSRNGSGSNFSNSSFNNGASNLNNGFGNSTGSGGLGNSDLSGEDLSADAIDIHPEIKVIGNTKIIADPRTNSIIVLGGNEAEDKVNQVLDQLDVRPQQVSITALIGELTLGDDDEFGINYLLRSRGLAVTNQFNSGFVGGNGGTPTTGGTTGTFTPANSSTLATLSALASGVSSAGGLAGIVSITNSFDLIVSALQSSSRFKTISRPRVMTTNNKSALITSGTSIPVPGQSLSSLTTGTEAAVSTTVSYRSVALTLSVLPLINSDKEVTLSIAQTVDNQIPGANVTVGGNSIPSIAQRRIKSTVSVPNGGTVVLGGLITQSDSDNDSKVPILNKIPVLGDLLFRSRTRNKNRGELVVLIHPEVLPTPESLEVNRIHEENKLYMEPGLEQQLDPLPRQVRRATAVNTEYKESATTTTTTATTRNAASSSAANNAARNKKSTTVQSTAVKSTTVKSTAPLKRE